MRRLLIATTNPSKLGEIRSVLEGLDLDLVGLIDLPPLPEPAETGETFAANARDKARYYAEATGELTLAEDSGLVIDGLDGAPGVHSARFEGDASYPERFRIIHRRLAERDRPASPARYVCALVLARGNAIVFETRATVEGRIASRPAGSGGFGYDPIFYYPPYGRTLAEVSDAEKAAVSHRGQAVRRLRRWLRREGSRL